jgi:uncharacterized protein with PIN domain
MRFVCDAMLGTLATYLRMCGHDTAYALDRDVEDADRVAELARREGRTLLTRNRSLAAREAEAILVEPHEVEDQLAVLVDAGIDLSLPEEPARCSVCNGSLVRVDATERTPEYAPAPDRDAVWRCPDCGQHFWRGSHWDDVAETLASL